VIDGRNTGSSQGHLRVHQILEFKLLVIDHRPFFYTFTTSLQQLHFMIS
jgi:hypothetical protein